MSLPQTWNEHARRFRHETYALYLACRDRRTPWYAKLIAGAVVAYAFSPIDLIPDFIPIIGHLDDLVLIPLGVWLVRMMIPSSVMEDCRRRAKEVLDQGKPVSWSAALFVFGVWLFLAALGYHFINPQFP